MMPEEKSQLLALFHSAQRWCREAEARDCRGNAVWFNDPQAVAWDVTGAVCHLFGWTRAAPLFRQLDRHINRRKAGGAPPVLRDDLDIAAMVALQEFNDRSETTYAVVREQLESMPAWRADDETEHVNGEKSGLVSETRAGAAETGAPHAEGGEGREAP